MRSRRTWWIATVMGATLLALARAGVGQPLAPSGAVWIDAAGNPLDPADVRSGRVRPACAVTIPARGVDTTNEAQLGQAGQDVIRVAETLKDALRKSPDMRRKVLEACQENGWPDNPNHPRVGWPHIPIAVYRDHPAVDPGTAHPASGTDPGSIALDLGDIDAVRDFFTPDSDPTLVDVISRSNLTRSLAHEFDHLRDRPARGAWGRTHGDPLGTRGEKGRPVEDENTVKEQVGSGDVRTAYGGDQIPFSGGTKYPGATATLRYLDLINRQRAVRRTTGGGGYGTIDADPIDRLPDRTCDGDHGEGCYPAPGDTDRDLDDVPDERDNCSDLANPWQVDGDGSGIGDDCEPPRDGGAQGRSLAPGNHPTVVLRAQREGGIQLMIVRVGQASTGGRPAPGGSEQPGYPPPSGGRPADPHLYLKSLGGSTGEVFEMAIVGRGAETVAPGWLVVEPVRLGVQDTRALQAEIAEARIRGVARRIAGYCLEFEGRAPEPERFFRIVGEDLQNRYRDAVGILEATLALREGGALHPDTNPETYPHSIAQWALWTHEEGFDPRTFEEAFLEHARKNLEATGQRWTEDIESVVRRSARNRWNDISAVLAAAGGR